ncbi:MAG: ribonuclease E/G, partial [Roseiarcus sp.]|uniref:Rne/Rng family ribonuclease n=1 Tax=Roseiarcus sp. TaxID=1969460 RepID=UPI003C255906
MSNKMIIDASHPEETRVVVLKGNRVEEFDFESANKKPLRGNIYLAKVTRVEPSLQAAFVDYGGNRHGFLAFSEIHPDYYQIPVADRQALLEDEARSHREDEEEPNSERRSRRHRRGRGAEAEMRAANDDRVVEAAPVEGEEAVRDEDAAAEGAAAADEPAFDVAAPDADALAVQAEANESPAPVPEPESAEAPAAAEPAFAPPATEAEAARAPSDEAGGSPAADGEEDDDEEEEVTTLGGGGEEPAARAPRRNGDDEGEAVEQIGGDEIDEAPRRAPRLRRQYKIQEVIKRRQVLLVQVVKEERGNKGAALTTYLSLAGRYSVLMPNTARGGGISRKITNAQDRGRLKAIADDLEVPEGMGVILRTAGASRTKAEVKRDFEYLLRMWETVRETTLSSSAPTLVYEEGSLIKRAIRDLYSKEVEEIVVAGESGFREARDFMRLLMPTHVKSVVPYRDSQPVFAKSGVEAQLDAMFSNQVTLKSGGYIVINQTEALVAIDVNSGRSTREHNIEDTALRTNLEAADEIARQLRLRDLAGLIVVDFIDMEEGRNNRAVERRMKDALKNDRARIQVGRISHFGLLEMSRQRIRTGVLEGSTVVCPHCLGAGVVRSTASVALHVLRLLEDALIKSATHDMTVRARSPVALYILNQKRAHLRDLERRFGVTILVEADDTLTGANHHAIERGEPTSGLRADEPAEARHAGYGASPVGGEDFVVEAEAEPEAVEEEDAIEAEPAAEEFEAEAGRGEAEPAAAGEGEPSRPRRRRRRRRGGERNERGERPASEGFSAEAPQPTDDGLAAMAEIGGDFATPTRGEGEAAEDDERAPSARRRRGRRGRRGGGDRERFGAPAPASDIAPVEGEAEPNLFDEPPREPIAAEPEAAPSAAEPEAAPSAAAAESTPDRGEASVVISQAPAPAAPTRAPAPASAVEPAAKADESAVHAAP